MIKFRKPDPNAPGQLAAELDDAKQRFEEVREGVISRGTKRMEQLVAMQHELIDERNAIARVVEAA